MTISLFATAKEGQDNNDATQCQSSHFYVGSGLGYANVQVADMPTSGFFGEMYLGYTFSRHFSVELRSVAFRLNNINSVDADDEDDWSNGVTAALKYSLPVGKGCRICL